MKNFLRGSALLFALIFSISSLVSPLFNSGKVAASGTLYARIGDTVELSPSDNSAAYDYSWVLKKGDEIIPQQVQSSGRFQNVGSGSSQTASRGNTFQHTFVEEGEYMVTLLRTSRTNNESQTTTIMVLVSLENPDFSAKKAVLHTLPPAGADEKVRLSGTSSEVIFLAAESRGDISEYHIDTDIAVDSDGDGLADNDIDNANSPSFFTGQAWEYSYSAEKKSRLAQLTTRFSNGKEEKTTVEILFDDAAQDALTREPLEAVLETIPAADQNGIIHVAGATTDVTFFSGNSHGVIAEYRIDKNINFDTDGDGKANNDIDNHDSASFRNGSAWETNFEKAWSPITIELLVVDANRKGSKMQRQIVFDKTATPGGNEGEQKLQKLIVSREEIFAGESVDFSLLGVPEGSDIWWDFDGDGTAEYEGIRQKNTYQYQGSGEFPVVIIAKKDGAEIARFEKTITVKEQSGGEILTTAPSASFIFSAKDNTVDFESTSSADNRLANSKLLSSWDFGDNATSDEEKPQHTFAAAQTYTVVLTVTDSVGRSSTTAQNVEVKSIAENPDEVPPTAEPVPTPAEETAADNLELGWLWTTLIILALPFVIFGGYLVFRKIQLPDLSFGEILHRDMEKIQELLNNLTSKKTTVANEVLPTGETKVAAPPANPSEVYVPEVVSSGQAPSTPGTPAPVAPAEMPPAAAPVSETPPTPKNEDVPDWLKTDLAPAPTAPANTAAENQASESTVPPELPESSPVSNESSADTPDWLKSDTLSSEAAPGESASAEEASTETPDWLKADFDVASPSTPAASESSANENAVPDWLSAEPEATPPAPTPTPQAGENTPPPAPENSGDIPEWLKSDDTPEETGKN